jgi:hypothetical protein
VTVEGYQTRSLCASGCMAFLTYQPYIADVETEAGGGVQIKCFEFTQLASERALVAWGS